jgi:flagellar biosynthesis/type III secretory pathway protein FliH
LGPSVEETIMTIAEQLKARGLEQGLQRGLEQGLQRGRRDSLEKLLALRFGPLPEAVRARLETAEPEAIERWLERVLSADSAEAVVEL